MLKRSSEFTRRLKAAGFRVPKPAFLLFLLLPSRLAAQQPCSVLPALENPQTTLSLHADSQKWINQVYYGRGNVLLTYREMRLRADSMTYDNSTGEITARGHVVFDDPRGHLEADEANYNIYTDRGWFSKAHGYMHYTPSKHGQVPASSFFVYAEKITRIDQETYTLERARVSSCQKEDHGVAFAMSRAKLEIGQRVTGHDAVFRFLGIPVFYVPAVVVAASREDRQTGFLLPRIGESTQKGFVLGDAFFWAINPSADLLLGLEEFSLRGLGITGRFRARPSASSSITADFFGIDDHASGALRSIRAPGGSFNITGESDDLGAGFRGVVDVDYVNSLAFRSTWSDNFNTAVFSEARQTGFATKDFSAYSINFYASRYQNFLSAAPVNEQSIIIRQVPSASFSGVDKEIGQSPFYFSFDTSLGGAGRSEPGFATPTLTDRLDLFPRLTLRSRPFWGFHLTPTFGVRETYYSTSLKPDHSPVNRFLGEFTLDLRPPSLEKTFSHSFLGRRFKHVIEPDIQYRLVKASDPQSIFDIVRFDDTEVLTDDNEIQFSLTNSLLERKAGPSGEGGSARDLISWTLTQKYYFDPTFGGTVQPGSRVAIAPTLSLTGFVFPEGRNLSPLNSLLKFSPSSRFDAELTTDLAPEGGGMLDAGITARVETQPLDLAFTDFFVNRAVLLPAPIAPSIPVTSLPTFHLLNMTASHGQTSHKGISEAFRVDYNIQENTIEDFVGQASYNFGCFALNAQYERFNLGAIRNENLFRLSITLGNVATFGSLKPAQFLQRQLRQIP
ncbi:MAG: LPS-assembly protein LptD [Terriglobia bacterium]